MNFLLVGFGGAFGSLVRYSLGRYITQKSDTTFPLSTFIINITGALLLGIVSSLNIGDNFYLLIADGFLGAYTTFSAFMYEGFNLFRDNKKLNAVVYILGSVILGLIGFVIGAGIVSFLKG